MCFQQARMQNTAVNPALSYPEGELDPGPPIGYDRQVRFSTDRYDSSQARMNTADDHALGNARIARKYSHVGSPLTK